MMLAPTVCVDASVAIKLVIPEHDSNVARMLWTELAAQRTRLIAPRLWGYEVTSVIRNRVYRNLYDVNAEESAFNAVHALGIELLQPEGLHQRASELARRFNRPAAYDSHYLALAMIEGCLFWTGDERLYNAVHDELPWVYWLGNYQLPP